MQPAVRGGCGGLWLFIFRPVDSLNENHEVIPRFGAQTNLGSSPSTTPSGAVGICERESGLATTGACSFSQVWPVALLLWLEHPGAPHLAWWLLGCGPLTFFAESPVPSSNERAERASSFIRFLKGPVTQKEKLKNGLCSQPLTSLSPGHLRPSSSRNLPPPSRPTDRTGPVRFRPLLETPGRVGVAPFSPGGSSSF